MDNIFGLSEQALELCEERASLISGNLANSATPNYKAKDIDFQRILSNTQSERDSGYGMKGNPGHLFDQKSISPQIMYRVPMQESLDGNTVDQEIERKNFIENSVRYEVNLTMIQNKTKELMSAIKGE